MSDRRLLRRLPLIVTVLLAILVYLNALENEFAVDDVHIVLNNEYVHGLGDLHSILLGTYWPDMPELYRPVALLSFAVDWALTGGAAWWFHLVNILLHATVTALVYQLVKRLGGSQAAAAAGAAIFAVHPVHVEAVANIVGRAEILSALFFLLACHLQLARKVAPVIRITGIAACYLVALGAKEIAVSLPAVLLLLSLFRDEDANVSVTRRTVVREAPLLIVLAITLGGYLVLRSSVLGEAMGSSAAPYLMDLSTSERLATAVRLWPEFARLLFWPADLSSEWGPGAITPVTWSHPLVAVGLVLGVSAAALTVVAWRQHRWLSLSVFWFVVTIFPVSQIAFPIGTMLAERNLYLPSVGLVFLLPPLVERLRRERVQSRIAVSLAAVAVILVGGWRTWQRNPAWHSTPRALAALTADHPESFRVWWNVATILRDQGRVDEAIVRYRRAATMTHGNLHPLNVEFAGVLLRKGRPREAEALMRNVIDIEPHRAVEPVLLATSLIDQGRFREALDVLKSWQGPLPRRSGITADFVDRAALAYDGLGLYDSALAIRRSSMQIGQNPPLYQEWYHLARLHELLGHPYRAAAALDSARVAAPAEVRSSITLDPLPPLASPLIRGWTDRAR